MKNNSIFKFTLFYLGINLFNYTSAAMVYLPNENTEVESFEFKKFNKSYKDGEYLNAINHIEIDAKNISDQNLLAKKEYLKALCYFKLQEFEKANESFKSAINKKTLIIQASIMNLVNHSMLQII